MLGIIKKIFGTKNSREIGRIEKNLIPQVQAYEKQLAAMSDDDLRAQTQAWKEECSFIQDNQELEKRLDELMPQAFAVVKEAAKRMCGQTIHYRGQTEEWNMVHFDVQLIGGYALHKRNIAEMATGEGKTLVATLPVYLNALSGRGVHVVTVNDYLAARDSEWMGALYKFLGLSVGVIQGDEKSSDVRREMYNRDITYGTNSEMGFDYLRDNGMAERAEHQVQRGHYFAIVDEVDSILIDEARTPLIISGPAMVKQDQRLYTELKPKIQALVQAQKKLCNKFLDEALALAKKVDGHGINEELDLQIGKLLYRVQQGQPRHEGLAKAKVDTANRLRIERAETELHKDQTKKELYAEKEHLYFAMDEKGHDADLTEKGRSYLSPGDTDAFMMPDVVTLHHELDTDDSLTPQDRLRLKQKIQDEADERSNRIHVTAQLLKAYCIYEKNTQYIVVNNKVVIVDENTGRSMEGRRWSDGLHQAVEAKEGVAIEEETQTYATITIQNYFRLYTKLSGMTGTAETEAAEFLDIYGLGVLSIPPNRPCLRMDEDDSVYLTEKAKYQAVTEEVKLMVKKGRPVLVGTVAVETSELIAQHLSKAHIPHSVLNAKHHEQEAEIVARAGQSGTVTIATNMAGRGTDIKLGKEVGKAGGLHVLGTERHESRRIDRQLRGRCARQGDPGSSHFFLSLEDRLMRLYGNSEKMTGWLEKLGMEEGEEISHPMLNRSIETAQKRVEQHHYQTRRRTLEYDDVMNKQRETLYGLRNHTLLEEDVRELIFDVLEEVTVDKVWHYLNPEFGEEGMDYPGLTLWLNQTFPIALGEEDLRNAQTDQVPREGSLYDGMNPEQFAVCQCIIDEVHRVYAIKVEVEDTQGLVAEERRIILNSLDRLWREHLTEMDALRQSVHLRSYGQKDPLVEYKTEARDMFTRLMANIKESICATMFDSGTSLQAVAQMMSNFSEQASAKLADRLGLDEAMLTAANSSVVSQVNAEVSAEEQMQASAPRPIRSGPKVGRNDPCPCGSGKKYKKCCG